ncbi:MAG: PfkB family carbohydrate kinase, partial [Anaerolineae bacterium]
VQEPNCGLITNAVRAEISALARLRPGKPFLADSRARIGLFREVMLKPNRDEAAQAISGAETASPADVTACGLELSRRVGRPVFVTLGAKGILVCEGGKMQRLPAAPVAGPIDPVGAGDSATAGIIAALCAGAAPEEAALVGNLAASITIRQLGTTGTATRREIQERFRQLPG